MEFRLRGFRVQGRVSGLGLGVRLKVLGFGVLGRA